MTVRRSPRAHPGAGSLIALPTPLHHSFPIQSMGVNKGKSTWPGRLDQAVQGQLPDPGGWLSQLPFSQAMARCTSQTLPGALTYQEWLSCLHMVRVRAWLRKPRSKKQSQSQNISYVPIRYTDYLHEKRHVFLESALKYYRGKKRKGIVKQ